ncbi:MAG: hypothetical protein LBS88_07830 [Tannerellaceae bacterium]|jgi:DNA-binding CsgD family transcriptional regulator|nr:hypothetical protein [Tannerellaceae bacterium]
MRRFLLYVVFVLFPSIGNAEVPYLPQIINYSARDYMAGIQNWAVAQDSCGMIYLGNNTGLLKFDGIHWKLYPLPHNTIVRSVYIGSNNRIYVGSFEEFGYFEPDETNTLIYHSLKEKLQGYTFFNDEIWTINEHEGTLYFQSFRSFFTYDGEHVKKGESPYSPLYFFTFNHRLYAQFISEGFYQYEGGRFVKQLSRQELSDDNVVGILPYDHKMLLVTTKSGIFLFDGEKATPWESEASDILRAGVANRVTLTQDSIYIIGTVSHGIVAIDRDGSLVWHISRKNNLINNTVLGLFVDASNNLWAALDDGAANIRIHSPLYFYEPTDVHVGMVHDIVLDGKKIYIATNEGVYVCTEEKPYPRLIPKSEGQSWCITRFDQQLFVGHNSGVLRIDNDQATRITGPYGGGTCIRKCIIHGKEVLLQSSYTFMNLYVKNEHGQWTFSHQINGFNNLIRLFEVDAAGNIWAEHMHKGLYQLVLDETLQNVRELKYLGRLNPGKAEGKIHVMKLRGRIVLSDGSMFYTYEDLSQQIVPYIPLITDLPGFADTYRIVSLNNHTFWFIRRTEYVLVNYDAGHFTARMRVPFALFGKTIVDERGNVYVDDEGVSYLCLNGGIARFDPNRLTIGRKAQITLGEVKASGKSNDAFYLLPARANPVEPVSIDYPHNSISFEVSFPDYLNRQIRLFYNLKGYEDEWKDVPKDYTVSYANLSYGKYDFKVFVEDERGNKIAILSYPFRIKPPLYWSVPAIMMYLLLFGFSLYLIISRYIRREVIRKNRLIKEQHQQQEQQIKEQEQLIIKLKNEKLENELIFKSKELTNAALTLIRYDDFFNKLKAEIQKQMQSGTYSKKYFEKLIHLIDKNQTREDGWEVFLANLDLVHENFFHKLKEDYPELTPGDLRICALLRLNIPTKDIARMQNLSIRGIEAARYRLRKKLNLPEGKSLVEFLILFNK